MLSNALAAHFANTVDAGEQRSSDRRLLCLDAAVSGPAGAGEIRVHNLSPTGMLVECTPVMPAGSMLEVQLADGATHRAQVVWADEGLNGCRFERPLSRAALSAALLRSDPAEAPAAPRPSSAAEALARLQETWAFEPEMVAPANETRLPVGARLSLILGLGLLGWAVPAAAAWVALV